MLNIFQSVIVNLIKRFGSLPSSSTSLVILTYHRVLKEADPLLADEVNIETFDWQMNVLNRHFNVISLSEAVNKLKAGTLPRNSVCVSFDDGYADNFSNALPILKRWNIPATFFIAIGYLNGGRMWNDDIIESVRAVQTEHLDLRDINLDNYPVGNIEQKQNTIKEIIQKLKYLPIDARLRQVEHIVSKVGEKLPTDLMMSTEQLLNCHENGIEIGGHTVNHPILAQMPVQQASQEIQNGKNQLQAILNTELKMFAYPNGKANQDYNGDHTVAVKDAGFIGAVTTEWGSATQGSDSFQLPRIAPWDRTPFRFALRIMRSFRQTQYSQV